MIVCNGDIVGYYPHPVESIKLIQKRCKYVIQGNHDEVVISKDFDREISWFNEIAAEALIWTRKCLFEPGAVDQLLFLESLKLQQNIEIETKNILLVHGTIEEKWEYFLKDPFTEDFTPEQRSRMRNWLKKWDLIVLGHTHQPFMYNHRNRMVLNPGSVGQPRDGNPNASYALVEITESKIEAEIIRVQYDIEKTCDALAKQKISNYLCQRLFLGR